MDREIVRYGDHERQHLLIYDHIPPFNEIVRLPPLVFIHGGAWRDPSNTSADADSLYKDLNRTVPLCSVDYRLSEQAKFPGFVDDVIGGTQRALSELGGDKVSLLGHSVGAMLALQCVDRGIPVDKVYLVDGIYDLEKLTAEYPDYKSFVDEAHEDYKDVKFDLSKLKGVEVHIIHSYDDELLSLGQTQWLIEQIQGYGIEYHLYVGHLGKHNEVYGKATRLADYVNRTYR
jgi:kynurenine formamidase